MSNKAWDLISYQQSAACDSRTNFDNHLKNQGHYCPYCDSENLSPVEQITFLGNIYDFVTCRDCNQRWITRYKLVDAYQES